MSLVSPERKILLTDSITALMAGTRWAVSWSYLRPTAAKAFCASGFDMKVVQMKLVR